MISLDQALAAYAAQLRPLNTETIPLTRTLRRVLREPAFAACDLPRFSQSALDGYVLTAEDAARDAGSLHITDAIAAGDTRPLRPLRTGECQRILTGGRVPPNAGAVVGQERVTVIGSDIRFTGPMNSGANIRWQGEELKLGTPVGETGQRLTPGLIASLASAGIAQIQATRVPRIAVLVGGDELKPVGEQLADGQIWDSNGPLVMSWLQSRGYAATVSHLPDSRAAVDRALADALAMNDLVITTGGVSVGDKDYVIPSAEAAGVRRAFWQVAQKPGKPIYFGMLRNSVLLGLPGNPGSVLIGLTLHVRMVLDLLEAEKPAGATMFAGTLVAVVKADAQRERLVRMRLEIDDAGRNVLHPLPHQDSHMLSNLGSATVLARLPARDADYAAGETLRWLWL